jgi:sugar/nucleoside kinase (ribokinase family)
MRFPLRFSPSLRSRDGQATVELVAVLPLVGVLVALLWQALLAGEAVWLSGGAARAAARAAAVGADPERAARAVLPRRFAQELGVRRSSDGAVAVTIRIPSAFGGGPLGATTARAQFEAQR